MERGLLWLPLLAVFFWLAWAGWNEYQKVQAYQTWAQSFRRSKYDIYAVLGQRDRTLVWGRPTRKGPVELQELSLDAVREIYLSADGETVVGDRPPPKAKKVAIAFRLEGKEGAIEIPFTDGELAARWYRVLQEEQDNS